MATTESTEDYGRGNYNTINRSECEDAVCSVYVHLIVVVYRDRIPGPL